MDHDSDSPEGHNTLPATTAPAELDANGFDLADYQWVPVLRRPRADGWTPQRQVEFIAALADYGCVEQAARAVGMSVTSCYRLRRSPGAENFAAAWEAAVAQAAHRLVDHAFNRAIHGSEEPVFNADGERVGRRMRQNDRLLMFLLRAYLPDRFRHAHKSVVEPGEAPPPEAQPVAAALLRLEPAAIADPHLLMPADELDAALECADILQGKLPPWHRGRPDIVAPVEAPLGEEFERMLDAAKRSAAGPPLRGQTDGDDVEPRPRRKRRR